MRNTLFALVPPGFVPSDSRAARVLPSPGASRHGAAGRIRLLRADPAPLRYVSFLTAARAAWGNLALMRRAVVNILGRDARKRGMRRCQKLAAWNPAYLEEVLAGGN